MELWIRTSDKLCLTKVHHLYVDSCNNIMQENDLILATYKTKERALEVLDEMQNILLLKDMYANDKEEIMKGWEKFSDEEIKLMRKKWLYMKCQKNRKIRYEDNNV